MAPMPDAILPQPLWPAFRLGYQQIAGRHRKTWPPTGSDGNAMGYGQKALFVDGVLISGLFQLDGERELRLANGVILPKGLEARADHLYPQLSIRDAVDLGLAVVMGLEFKAFRLLLALLVHGMKDDFGVSDRLAVRVFYHQKLQGRRLAPRQRGQGNQQYKRGKLFHVGHVTILQETGMLQIVLS